MNASSAQLFDCMLLSDSARLSRHKHSLDTDKRDPTACCMTRRATPTHTDSPNCTTGLAATPCNHTAVSDGSYITFLPPKVELAEVVVIPPRPACPSCDSRTVPERQSLHAFRPLSQCYAILFGAFFDISCPALCCPSAPLRSCRIPAVVASGAYHIATTQNPRHDPRCPVSYSRNTHFLSNRPPAPAPSLSL